MRLELKFAVAPGILETFTSVGIVTAQSKRHMHCIMTCLSGTYVSDGCQMGVRFVTAQSTRHMHYIMTCLSGECVVCY